MLLSIFRDEIIKACGMSNFSIKTNKRSFATRFKKILKCKHESACSIERLVIFFSM
jgi:hypothetical protein